MSTQKTPSGVFLYLKKGRRYLRLSDLDAMCSFRLFYYLRDCSNLLPPNLKSGKTNSAPNVEVLLCFDDYLKLCLLAANFCGDGEFSHLLEWLLENDVFCAD